MKKYEKVKMSSVQEMSKFENHFAASHFIVYQTIQFKFTVSSHISRITDNYFMFLSHRFFLLFIRHKIIFANDSFLDLILILILIYRQFSCI
jgi:hypothetical protein